MEWGFALQGKTQKWPKVADLVSFGVISGSLLAEPFGNDNVTYECRWP